MLHFLQSFMYYMTVEVVEPNWAALEAALRGAATLDDVTQAHDRFLDTCMKEGMLFWPRILRRLERIKSICLRFAATTAALAPAEPPPPPPPPQPGTPGRARLSAGAAPLSPAAGGGGGAFGVGSDRAEGFGGRRSRAAAAGEAAAATAAASEPGFAAAMRAQEAQFDTALRELVAALNASRHLEPNLANLVARLQGGPGGGG